MPGADGYETLIKIRNFEKRKSLSPTPVIASTAPSGKKDEIKCLSAGFDDFIEKPFEKKILNEMIHKNKRSSRRLGRQLFLQRVG